MTVWVDDAMIPFGRMRMSHLFASLPEELFVMVDAIGVQRKWLQRPLGARCLLGGVPTVCAGMDASWWHFDIAAGKRLLAISAGAVAISYRHDLARLAADQRAHPEVWDC